MSLPPEDGRKQWRTPETLQSPAVNARNIKRVLLLGATGRTGRHVLHHALLRGLDVVALVRSPDRVGMRAARLKVIMGSPLNPVDVADAIDGCDAVVSALNSVRTSDSPWSLPLSPPLFLAHCIGNCITEMRRRDIRRVVVMSALGVGNTLAHAPLVLRWLIRHSHLKRMYADQNVQEQLLGQSGLAWTSVRTNRLTDGGCAGPLMVATDEPANWRNAVSRECVAQFLIDCLATADYVGKTPSLFAA
jgi:nucleoside-diphosphate-sugar epimerase